MRRIVVRRQEGNEGADGNRRLVHETRRHAFLEWKRVAAPLLRKSDATPTE
jgi:hypothetical protein